MLKKREWKERNETDKWPDLLGAVSNTWFTRQHSTSLASPLKINFISKRLRFFIIRKKNFVEDINGYILIVSIVELTRFLHQIQRVRIRRSQCLIIRQRCIVRSKVNIDVNSIVDCLFMVICLTVVKYTCLFFLNNLLFCSLIQFQFWMHSMTQLSIDYYRCYCWRICVSNN